MNPACCGDRYNRIKGLDFGPFGDDFKQAGFFYQIDFIEGQALWDDPDRLVIPARTVDEPRFMIIGYLAGAVWSGVFTIRDENIRIISVRRSRKEEIALYESERI